MSTYQSAAGPAGDGASYAWGRGGCSRFRLRPLEIAAVVIGFMIWWPLGLALLAMKFAARRGYNMDRAMAHFRDTMRGFGAEVPTGHQWRPFSASGNMAFDEWRAAEMARLEEERRKLEEAQQAFAEHLDNLRRARDREEFDRFMAARRAGQGSAPQA